MILNFLAAAVVVAVAAVVVVVVGPCSFIYIIYVHQQIHCGTFSNINAAIQWR